MQVTTPSYHIRTLCLSYYSWEYDWAQIKRNASLEGGVDFKNTITSTGSSFLFRDGYIKTTINLLHTDFIQEAHEPVLAVPKPIKSKKLFFPDMVINIYKTVIQVKYRVHWSSADILVIVLWCPSMVFVWFDQAAELNDSLGKIRYLECIEKCKAILN